MTEVAFREAARLGGTGSTAVRDEKIYSERKLAWYDVFDTTQAISRIQMVDYRGLVSTVLGVPFFNGLARYAALGSEGVNPFAPDM